MNTESNLFTKVITHENFELAIKKAAVGKRKKTIVIKTLKNSEYIASQKLNEVQNGIWRPQKIHAVKVINDGIQLKKREIVCPDFVNEQVVHHAIMNVVAPVLMKR